MVVLICFTLDIFILYKKHSEFGDELWVALNSDASVRTLKGESRPIFSQNERAYMLNALECVSLIFLFEDDNLSKEILHLKPDVYVKSGDYSFETLNVKEKNHSNLLGLKYILFLTFMDLALQLL